MLDDLARAMGGSDKPELQSIMRATQLQALLLAYDFFRSQDNPNAAAKVATAIPKLTTQVVKDAS